VSPLIQTSGQIIGGNINHSPKEMIGVGTDFLIVRNWPLATGDFISSRDVAGAARVCIIGQTVANQLFPDEDPIGQQVRVKSIPLRVIGVLTKRGANMVGQDQDDIVLMPYTTVRKRLQGSAFTNVGIALVSAKNENLSAQAQAEINVLLRERHRIPPGEKPDFEVRNMAEVENILNMITGALTAMLSAIAAISLVVGGVGIMNIMLVSVTERTREIGIRMALGADGRSVRLLVMRQMGGMLLAGVLLGIAAALGLGRIVQSLLYDMPGHDPIVFVLAVVLIAIIAALAGYLPARRASQVDPMHALRSD
jgi:putative ABC transport system permease protein